MTGITMNELISMAAVTGDMVVEITIPYRFMERRSTAPTSILYFLIKFINIILLDYGGLTVQTIRNQTKKLPLNLLLPQKSFFF